MSRRSLIAMAAVAWLPIFPAELPAHYLTGRVCSTKTNDIFYRAGYPCSHPIRGVTITAHNATGDSVVATSDRHGWYSLPSLELSGTHDDYVMFRHPKYAAVIIGLLRYAGDVVPDPLLGATVFLRKLPKVHEPTVPKTDDKGRFYRE